MQLNILLSNVASFMKRRLIELFGLILIALCFLFTFTLALYSPENTTLIYKAEGAEAINIFNYYSNITADFFLQSFGLMSFVIGICILSWGINFSFCSSVPKDCINGIAILCDKRLAETPPHPWANSSAVTMP